MGSEFIPHEIKTKPNPAFLDKIKDENFKEFGKELNEIWKDLGRKTNENVAENSEKYSFIPLPENTVVPTGTLISKKLFFYRKCNICN